MELHLLKPRYCGSLLTRVASFVKAPTDTADSETSLGRRISDTVGLSVPKILILILIPISIVIGLIHDAENLTTQSLAERFSPVMLLLVGGVLSPRVEEACFRLSLRFGPIFLSLSSGVLLYFILTKAVFQTKVSAIDASFPTRFAAVIALSALLFPVVSVGSVRQRPAQILAKPVAHNLPVVMPRLASACLGWSRLVSARLGLSRLASA